MKWFISDLHIDHSKVLVGPRGDAFPTIEEWQGHILEAINSRVGKADHLYILGDFAFKDQSKWRQKIRHGNLWLIWGNHDPSIPSSQKVFGQGNVRETMNIKIHDQRCWLSHYAHAFWPASHHGSFHLYGHCHDQRESTLDEWMPERRSMEVSPESIYRITGEWRPINEEEIYALLIAKKGHDQLDFYQHRRGYYEDK